MLGEPFLLASYPIASQKLAKSNQPEQNTRFRYVSATSCPKGTGEGFVTMSVQGDGIHVLELSTMHASVSHTLGPSAFFAAPAVTRFDGLGATTCYAVMQSAPDGINPKERGRTVQRWRDQESRRPEELPEPKLSVVFPQLVECIWAPPALASHVLAVSPSGQLMLADQDLKLVSSGTIPDIDDVLIGSWLFEPEECTFLPRSGESFDGVVVLCFISHSDRLKLRITLARETGELRQVLELDMGLQEHVADISCDSSGFISVMTQTGEWKFFRLSHEHAGPVTATSLTDSIRLSGLSFDSSSDDGNHRVSGLSLLSVGSSYVLFAGIVCGSSPQIALLLWDIQYSVVLASQFIAVPSTVAYAPGSLPNLELVPSSRAQALLVISPSTRTASRRESSTHSRSSIFVVPLEVPSVSTIALAMGKARDTQKWLQTTHNLSSHINEDEDDARSKMVRSVRNATEQGRARAAEDAFFVWVEEETARLKKIQKKLLAADNSDGDKSKARKASSDKTKWKKGPLKPILSHNFVSSMLSIAFRPTKPSTESLYPSKIVQYLINRKAVGDAMVEGGLIPALRRSGDWESIYSSLKNVSDIPEADLVNLLAEVVESHRRYHHSQETSMQVDSPANIQPLAKYLAALVAYTTSPAMLRLALKDQLTDVRDVTCVLEVLEGWVARWCGKGLALTFNVDHPADASQPHIVKTKVGSSRIAGLPSLENIMSFLQCVLDTHFLALLQHSACHDTMERLTKHFKQQLTCVDEMSRLRGPLESFIRAEAREARFKSAQKVGDWRKKKEASQTAELAIGLYQIEELMI